MIYNIYNNNHKIWIFICILLCICVISALDILFCLNDQFAAIIPDAFSL